MEPLPKRTRTLAEKIARLETRPTMPLMEESVQTLANEEEQAITEKLNVAPTSREDDDNRRRTNETRTLI